MIFYIGLFLLLNVFSFCYSKSKDFNASVIFKILSFLVLFLPATFRYGIGTDYFNYVDIFYDIKNGYNTTKEFGWYILNIGVINLKLQYQWIFVISSFITYLILLMIPKNDFWITITSYYIIYYTFSFNAIRNAMALSFMILAYFAYEKKKMGMSLFLILCGCLYHISNILFVFVFLAAHFFKINKKMSVLVIFASLLFIDAFFYIIYFLLDFYGIAWIGYFSSAKFGGAAEVSSGLGIFFRRFLALALYLGCDERQLEKRNFSLISFLFIGLILFDFMTDVMYIFQRLIFCFNIYYIVLFTNIYRIKNKTINIVISKYIYVIFYFFYYLVLSLYLNHNEVVPYMHI